MAAFARAVELGYRYLETDVQVTADDVLVVFHDERLDRVTDRPGEIGSLTWREVCAARIGGTDPIPLFADVLASWPDVCVNVDPESDRAVGPLVRTIQAAEALDRVCIGSFSDHRLRRHRPRWRGPGRPTGPGQALGYAWPPGDCYPAARCQVPRPARRFLCGAGSSPSPSAGCFPAPTSSSCCSTSGRRTTPARCTIFSSSVWTALSAMTSSPYVPCYETAANGIRGERTRLRRWPIKPQALCPPCIPVGRLNAYLWPRRSGATSGNGGPHSGSRIQPIRMRPKGSSPPRPTAGPEQRKCWLNTGEGSSWCTSRAACARNSAWSWWCR